MNAFNHALIEEVKRRLFEENVPRIKACLAQLTETEVWHRPNENSNSVGNLVLHLCGNARQWIVAGLGGKRDIRARQAEFDERGPMSTEALLAQLDSTIAEVATTLEAAKSLDLLQKRPVQVYEESGISILVHVTEHFSYHVGQITYVVKATKDIDTAYYAGQDL